MDPFVVAIVAIACSFSLGAVKIVLRSIERQSEMKLRIQQSNTSETTQAIEELRKEVSALRDTSMQYDISLDHALHRLEQRMDHVETTQRTQSAAGPMSDDGAIRQRLEIR